MLSPTQISVLYMKQYQSFIGATRLNRLPWQAKIRATDLEYFQEEMQQIRTLLFLKNEFLSEERMDRQVKAIAVNSCRI